MKLAMHLSSVPTNRLKAALKKKKSKTKLWAAHAPENITGSRRTTDLGVILD